MGILKRLRDAVAVPAQQDREIDARLYVGKGSMHQEVVGESFYQPALLQCLHHFGTEPGADTADLVALLRPEPTNPYDPNAVAVVSPFGQVGHLPRATAAKWNSTIQQAELRNRRAVAVNSRIFRGSAGVCGIWLDWPIDHFAD